MSALPIDIYAPPKDAYGIPCKELSKCMFEISDKAADKLERAGMGTRVRIKNVRGRVLAKAIVKDVIYEMGKFPLGVFLKEDWS